MKRASLKVGDELYWAKPWEWDNYYGKKVTVVSVEPYEWSRVYRKHMPRSNGNGVLVEFDVPGDNRKRQDIAMLGHLRGPYETVTSEVEADRAARAEANRIASEAADARMVRAAALIDRLKTFGVSAYPGDGSRSLSIGVNDVEKLLDAYESREG